MRRFVTLLILLLFAIPFGVSISGCSKNAAPTFCNGGDSGITTGTVTTITLLPKVYGISLNYAEIGQITGPSAADCKGAAASVAAYTYGTTDMTLADIQPTTGRICGGTWNRNTGGGIPDYTVCNPTGKTGTAYVTASADGVTSNPLPVYIHPVVTGIVLGAPSTNCATDPATNCSPAAFSDTASACTVNPANGCCTAPVIPTSTYVPNACVSQGVTSQLVARVYAGTGTSQANISCLAGHLQFTPQITTPSIVTIDPNGVTTAVQPGSTLITANVSNAASSAGYFSVCPPKSITLSVPGAQGTSAGNVVTVNQNNTIPLIATVTDTNNNPITGLALEYVSTAPTTVPAGAGTVTPAFAGSASISAICQPGACNPASYSQIGLFGNGKPITSNSVNFSAPGTNSTVLYMASTQSELVVPIDFTTKSQGAPLLLPYVPNSMIISNDGSTIYMGSSTALMVLNAINTLTVSRVDISSPGVVLAISPDGTQILLTDPVRQTITLESSSGSVLTTFGGVGTHAQFAPDGQTVYVTTGTVTTQQTTNTPAIVAPGPQVLVYSAFTGWSTLTDPVSASDVAITVPSVGAYFAGTTTIARTYCAASTPASANGVTSESNAFFPQSDIAPLTTDRIAATNDGLHILGATATPKATLNDLRVNVPVGSCPLPASATSPSPGLTFSNTPSSTVLSQINASAITGVLPASDSSIAFVTYTGTGGAVPAYAPVANGPGTTTYIKLSGTASAPIAGVVSADNTMLYVGTSGDNLVHLINRSTLSESSTLAPRLVDLNGNIVPVNLLVQKPRKTT